jgi:internalin A
MRDLSIWARTFVPLLFSLAACESRALSPDPGAAPAQPTGTTPVVGPTQRDCSQGVRLADPALDGAIHAAIGLPPGPISALDAAGLTELRAPELGIRSLAGMECFVNLELLELNLNDITDISPLAALVNLTALDLNQNNVHTISAVARMTNLVELDLVDNGIDDLRPVTGLPNLFRLALSGNAIQDLRPLHDLPQLRMLELEGNAISDVSPLTALDTLGEVWLSRNPLVNLSPIASIPSLYSLTLVDTPSADLSTLASSSLINIDLSHNTVPMLVRLPPQQFFPSLKWISFADSALGDAEIIRLLPMLSALDLESLVLTDNQISNLAPLAQTRSGNLYLTNNQITDLSPILAFPSPPVLFVDVRTNPFDCGAQSATIAGAGPIYIYTDCP